ncbi:fibroblast growth factor 18 isoform X2 [Nematostella vectensis]|uniref:fibroblast growth factor 18 isoform X2 n=1 Tax=Nematostella vectensis TaxID=45351 RepID=UPI0020772A1C|nr:fibroblast growth factor 18 isoform X2 [Nematostella vectensis]
MFYFRTFAARILHHQPWRSLSRFLRYSVIGCTPTTSVTGHPARSLDPHVEIQRLRTDPFSLPFYRETQLYSRSSRGHLRIFNRQIDAEGKDGDPYAKLILESDTFGGRVKIKGDKTKHYLCIKKDGRLTSRKIPKSPKCVFKEAYTDDFFTQFISAYNPKWMITVSKKGHTRPGFKGRNGSRSVQFIARASKIVIETDIMKNYFRQHILQLLREYRIRKGTLPSRVTNTDNYKSRLSINEIVSKKLKKKRKKKKNRKLRKRNRKRKQRKLARKRLKEKGVETADP